MNPHASEERDAFLHAYGTYYGAIERHCQYRVFDAERARDLAQETFLRTWLYLLRGGKVLNMRAFLYRIANNLIVDESRKQREASLDYLQEKGFDPSQDDQSAQVQARLDIRPIARALGTLDGRSRSVLVMRYVQGLPPREIAVRMGTSANSVSVCIYRGLHQLRARVERRRQ